MISILNQMKSILILSQNLSNSWFVHVYIFSIQPPNLFYPASQIASIAEFWSDKVWKSIEYHLRHIISSMEQLHINRKVEFNISSQVSVRIIYKTTWAIY